MYMYSVVLNRILASVLRKYLSYLLLVKEKANIYEGHADTYLCRRGLSWFYVGLWLAEEFLGQIV